MILQTQESNIQIIGETQETKVSIDPKDLEFITTLLSSNLYSKPVESFIREIVSNAWDSQVEANTTNVPILISIKENEYNDNYNIAIRDFGTGLSPKKFKSVFCSIGSSTKRDSNNYIGAFGIGRFSSLACSNIVFITSYYNGMSYLYIMTKDGNVITTNLVKQEPTDEKNGVQIELKEIKNPYAYVQALKKIVFFPNVYLDSDVRSNFNNIKIKRFEHFSVANTLMENKLLIGNVLYPCNSTQLSTNSRNFINRIGSTGIVINFNIGEVQVTPNREEIQYTAKTIKVIEEHITKAREVLDNLCLKKIKFHFDNLLELYNTFKGRSFVGYDLIEDEIDYNEYSNTTQYSYKIDKKQIYYKNTQLDENVFKCIFYLLNTQLVHLKGYIKDNVFYSNLKKTAYSEQYLFRTKNDIVVIPTGTKLTTNKKNYLKSKFSTVTIIEQYSKEDFIKHMIEQRCVYLKTVEKKDEIINWFYDYLQAKAKYIDFNTDKDYIDYLKNNKKSKKVVVKYQAVEVPFKLHELRYNSLYTRVYNSITECCQYLKNLHRPIILIPYTTPISDSDIALAEIINASIFKVGAKILNILKQQNLSCIINENRLYNHPKIIQFATCFELLKLTKEPIVEYRYLMGFQKSLPQNLNKALMFIVNYYYKYKNSKCALNCIINNVTKRDDELITLYKKILDYLYEFKKLIGSLNIIPNSQDVLNMMILKSKLYNIGYKNYNQAKNNKIIQLLCKK